MRYLKTLIKNLIATWRSFFRMEIQLDVNEILSYKEIQDPKYGVTKIIMFIYSMETHIPYDLNAASRNQDLSKIETLGPFAAALSYIVQGTD